MSTPFLVVAALVITALFASGCGALAFGMNKLFFTATFGALLAAAIVYFGAFVQGLRPASRLAHGQRRTASQELQALAEANPDRPVLKRVYGWLLVLMAVAVVLRLIQLLAA